LKRPEKAVFPLSSKPIKKRLAAGLWDPKRALCPAFKGVLPPTRGRH